MSDHPTRTLLERLSVDDLPAATASSTRTHVQGCTECTTFLDELEKGRASYFAAHPAGVFMEGVVAKKPRRWRWPVFALVPSIAIVAIFVTMRPTNDTRYKGGGIDVLRKHGDAADQLGPEDSISAGDELGFVLMRGHAGEVAAWSVDSSGRVDALTHGAISLAAGDQRLPQSAVVEAPCRDLTLIATDDPAWFAATPDALRAAAQSPPPGVIMRKLHCR